MRAGRRKWRRRNKNARWIVARETLREKGLKGEETEVEMEKRDGGSGRDGKGFL